MRPVVLALAVAVLVAGGVVAGCGDDPAPTARSACPGQVAGVSRITLTVGATDYDVRVYVPSAAGGETGSLPVVLNWHGLGSDGDEQALLTGYEDLAEEQGFVVVHPTGPPALTDLAVDRPRTTWELTDDGDPDRDDVAFAAALIDELTASWCVDEARVYSTGLSNGGYFTARLVCELADRLAGASSVAGLWIPDDCEPARPVPYVAYHGTEDQVVPYDGDGESVLYADLPPALVDLFSRSIRDEFDGFAASMGCDARVTVVELGGGVRRYDHTGCDEGVELQLHELTGGGHTWPGSAAFAVGDGAFGATTLRVSATADSWAFFSEHTPG